MEIDIHLTASKTMFLGATDPKPPSKKVQPIPDSSEEEDDYPEDKKSEDGSVTEPLAFSDGSEAEFSDEWSGGEDGGDEEESDEDEDEVEHEVPNPKRKKSEEQAEEEEEEEDSSYVAEPPGMCF